MSTVSAVVGAQWGDEGKGKLVDCLAQDADYVVRFQGGANAGHTINNHFGRFALHLLPSGVFSTKAVNVLGMGVALDLEKLFSELDNLVEREVPAPRLILSDRAHILLPHHILMDKFEEERLGGSAFGSTRSGISPFYADKARKRGIQLSLLRDENRLSEAVRESLVATNVLFEHLYKSPPVDPVTVLDYLDQFKERALSLMGDVGALLRSAIQSNKKILIEGQLGSLRDIEHGIYPYTTSVSTLAGFAAIGAGIPPHRIERIIAVAKAYSSMVGTGRLVSKIADVDTAAELRRRGGDKGEFGATTGRPRDVGWFDAVATRYGVEVQGATEVCLTNLDVLGYLDSIPVCTEYRIDGKTISDFPVESSLERAEPIFENLPGWNVSADIVSTIRHFEDLPENAKVYVQRLEELIGVKISIISVGPGREDIIYR